MSLVKKAQRAFSIDDLRLMSQARLPKSIFEFFDGGAEQELTLRDNLAAFQRVRLLPKALNDVSVVDTTCNLVGGRSSLPIAVAPTGALNFGRPGSDIAIAKAATAMGIPYTLSTSATTTIEDIANAASGRLWFQAYILSNKEKLAALIERARVAEYEGLMITVDLPVGGKRERDFRNQLSFPMKFTPKNVMGFAAKPLWAMAMLASGIPALENIKELKENNPGGKALVSSVGKNYDPAFNWTDLQKIRDKWSRKLIVKGVMRSADADRLAQMGIDAIVVSNHGGRQLDGAAATMDALPGVVEGAAGRLPVLVDGGVRRGVDVVKAIASGAQGVLIGRATLFGAHAAGDAGAKRALDILKDELIRSMQLCGVKSINEITADLLLK